MGIESKYIDPQDKAYYKQIPGMISVLGGALTIPDKAMYASGAIPRPANKGLAGGFDLKQWFTDNNISGDQSYYRYAQIRKIDPALAQAQMQRFGQAAYTYAGDPEKGDNWGAGPQNVTPLGVDSNGYPLGAANIQAQQSADAMRQARARGMSTGGGGTLASPLNLHVPTLLGGN
jgi:hypothetical protein